MAVDLTNFLHSLCRYIVARAAARTPAVAIAYLGTPRALWRTRADQADAADPYTVLRYGPGPAVDNDPLPRASVQVLTTGKDPEAALTRSQIIFEALCGDDPIGLPPARMVTIGGYRASDDAADGHWLIVSIDPLQRPGLLAPTQQEREQVSFNVDVGFVKKD
jgi:hypothetical protein